MKIVDLIGAIIVMIGVILLYDARPLTRKFFSFGDQNEATLGLKIVGLAVSLIGSLISFIF